VFVYVEEVKFVTGICDTYRVEAGGPREPSTFLGTAVNLAKNVLSLWQVAVPYIFFTLVILWQATGITEQLLLSWGHSNST
jgi:hypothetical protein